MIRMGFATDEMSAAERMAHYEDHVRLRADIARWATETDLAYVTDDGVDFLEWANCRICGSTLAVPA